MFVVTVIFSIREGTASKFMVAMKKQAYNSLRLEKGCHLFDVCVDEKDEHRVFLYELYSSRAAFDDHLASDHFQAFNTAVMPMVEDKEVSFWTLEEVDQ